MFRQGKALVPSFTAFAVTRLLREHFGDFVDVGFTAEMEEILDEISNGEQDWLDFIREFYRGDGKHTRPRDHRSQARSKSIDYPMIDLGADPRARPAGARAHRPLRAVPAARRERRAGPTRLAAATTCAPADLTVEKALKLLRPRPRGRDRSASIPRPASTST